MTLSTVPGRFDPMSLILGWLWPGLGHLAMGQRKRGVLVMSGICGLFFFGVLVGGVDVVDQNDDWLWFLPQALAGPVAFIANYLNGAFVKTGILGTPSIARVNEMGTLFTALAGLMNLAAMIDASTRDPLEAPADDPMLPARRASDRPVPERRSP